MRKIALICMLQLHKNSGSARTAVENIMYFNSKGFEVHVAAMTIDKFFFHSLGATPHKMIPFLKSTGLLRRKWYNWQIEKLVAKIKPSIIVGHGDILKQDFLTLHNCVFLASELINGAPLPKNHEMAVTHGKILKEGHFKQIIANSNLMKNDLITRFQIPENKINVIYPSVNTNLFKPQKDQKIKLKEKFKLPQKIVVSLVTSGNLKKRGLDTYIESIQLIPRDIKEKVSFRVIGKEDPAFHTKGYVTFDPPTKEIQDYYNAIDIFVLPARIEEFGRVVLEAMASGCPVITTNKVGASELLEDESREFIIEPNSPKILADSLVKLIEDEHLRFKLGELNFKSSLKESESLVFEKFDNVFKIN